MILFKNFANLEYFIIKRYKSIWSKYATTTNIFYDVTQRKRFIDDLYKFNFLVEVKNAKPKDFFDVEISDNSQFLLNDIDLDNHLKDHNELKQGQYLYELLTIDNVCELLKITRPSVYKLIKEGKLKTKSIFNRKRVMYKDYIEFVKSMEDSSET